MSTENNSTKFKILIGILSLLLIALAVYTFTIYNDRDEKVTSLEREKQDIEGELEELIANYDEIIQDNELKDKDLLAARERIEVLLDSVKDSEANISLIQRYKVELGKLKEERKMLFRKADSLIAVNDRLVVERDSTNTVLTNTRKLNDSVTVENEVMAEVIKKGSIVTALDLRGEAVIVRTSGKVVDTKRSSRADKIRTCFSLTPNPIAKKGDRKLYVQVINPRNNLLGTNATLKYDNGLLNYSATANVFYENDELDVCILVDAKEADLIEGRYVINLFDGPNQIATTTMELK